mmetsp:Transcript_27286/g.57364  ORF Transcript_27286/g.57364 Transcript_27286/m.57364 type:complete len:242 (+) Transcript_27286:1028-1753(+)
MHLAHEAAVEPAGALVDEPDAQRQRLEVGERVGGRRLGDEKRFGRAVAIGKLVRRRGRLERKLKRLASEDEEVGGQRHARVAQLQDDRVTARRRLRNREELPPEAEGVKGCGDEVGRDTSDMLMRRAFVHLDRREFDVSAPRRQHLDDGGAGVCACELTRVACLPVLVDRDHTLEQLPPWRVTLFALFLVVWQRRGDAGPLAADGGVLARDGAVGALRGQVVCEHTASQVRVAALVGARDG